MKSILLIFILSVCLFGQGYNDYNTYPNYLTDAGLTYTTVQTETFTTFDGHYTMDGKWIFSSDYHTDISGETDATKDISGNNHDLSLVGWSDVADMNASMGGTSNPIYSGADTLSFDGSSESFRILAASAGFANVSTGDLTLLAWVYADDFSAGTYPPIFCKRLDGANQYYIRFRNDGDLELFGEIGDVRKIRGLTTYTTEAEDDRCNFVVVAVDRGTDVLMYFDGNSVNVSNKEFSADDMDNIGSLNIGYDGSVTYYNGSIISVSFVKSLLNAAEIRKEMSLESSWYSKLGNVTRERLGSGFAFHQGFYDSDTVYVPVTDGTGTYRVTVNAKGTKSGDVMRVWLGSGSAVSQTLTASATNYTLNLGSVTASGDSLFFEASASDSIYIDNITLELGQ